MLHLVESVHVKKGTLNMGIVTGALRVAHRCCYIPISGQVIHQSIYADLALSQVAAGTAIVFAVTDSSDHEE